MPSDPGRMTPDDDLPELTDSERAAMDALPPDFVTRLLGGEKLEFGPEGKPVRWVRQTTPDAEAVRLAERLVLISRQHGHLSEERIDLVEAAATIRRLAGTGGAT